jgi:hypothetical protein
LIDYVLVDTRLASAVLAHDVTWQDASTDHAPVRVRLSVTAMRQEHVRRSKTRWRWNFKRTNARDKFDWSPYRDGTGVALTAWAHRAALDSQAESVPCAAGADSRVEQLWASLSEVVLQQMREHVGLTRVSAAASWWWTPALTRLKHEKREAWRALTDARAAEAIGGDAAVGAACAAYVESRRRYRRELRQASLARENDEVFRADDAHRDPNEMKCLWHIINKRSGSTSVLPQAVADRDGDLVTDSDERLRVIAEFQQARGTPPPATDPRFDPAALARAQDAVRRHAEATSPNQPLADTNAATIGDDASAPTGASDATPPPHLSDEAPSTSEVSAAISRLWNWKSGGGDDWVPEAVTKADRAAMSRALALLYAAVWEAGEVPAAWKDGAIVYIAKNDTASAPHDLANYRPLTMLSVASKVLEHVLNARLHAWAEAEPRRVDDAQGGFRADRGCGDLVFVLAELLQRRRERAAQKRPPAPPGAAASAYASEAGASCHPTYVAFLDVADAYGSVDHACLFHKLWDKGVRGKMWRLLRAWYQGASSHVRVDGATTESFPVQQGVRQGAVLSPMLYALFLDDLLRRLRAAHLGTWEDGLWLGAHAYADDICLVADTPDELREMLSICEDYAREWRFRFKPAKSKVMVTLPLTGEATPSGGATQGANGRAKLPGDGSACELPRDDISEPPTWLARGHAPDTRRAEAVVGALLSLAGPPLNPPRATSDSRLASRRATRGHGARPPPAVLLSALTSAMATRARAGAGAPGGGATTAANGRLAASWANTAANVADAIATCVRARVLSVVGPQDDPFSRVSFHHDFSANVGAARARGGRSDDTSLVVAAAAVAVRRKLIHLAVKAAANSRPGAIDDDPCARPRKHASLYHVIEDMSPAIAAAAGWLGGPSIGVDDLLETAAGATCSVLYSHPAAADWLYARSDDYARSGWIHARYVIAAASRREAAWVAYDRVAQALWEMEATSAPAASVPTPATAAPPAPGLPAQGPLSLPPPFTVAGGDMAAVTSFRYLGVSIDRDGGWDGMANGMVLLSRLRAEKTAFVGLRHGDFSVDTAWYFWNAICAPLLNNAVQVWSCTQRQCAKMDAEIVRAGASVLGVGKRTSASFVLGELKQMRTAPRQDHLLLRFFGHLGRMPDYRVVKKFFLLRHRDTTTRLAYGFANATAKDGPQAHDCTLSWCLRLHRVLHAYGAPDLWDPVSFKAAVAARSKDAWEDWTDSLVKDTEAARWRARQREDGNLRPIYTNVKTRPGLEPYLLTTRPQAGAARAVARLRCGLVGEVYWGRRARAPPLPRDQRLCSLCAPTDPGAIRARQEQQHARRTPRQRQAALKQARRAQGAVADRWHPPMALASAPLSGGAVDPIAPPTSSLPVDFCTDLDLPGQRVSAPLPSPAGGALGDSLHILGVCPAVQNLRRRGWARVCEAIRAHTPSAPGVAARAELIAQLGAAGYLAGCGRLLLVLGSAPVWWPCWAETLGVRAALSMLALAVLGAWESRVEAIGCPPLPPAAAGSPPNAAGEDDDASLSSAGLDGALAVPPVPRLVRLPNGSGSAEAEEGIPPVPPLAPL